jgi:hypothetical protein
MMLKRCVPFASLSKAVKIGGMNTENSAIPNAEGSKNSSPKPKKEKPSVDPAKRGHTGFDKSILKGKKPIFMKMKKSGR